MAKLKYKVGITRRNKQRIRSFKTLKAAQKLIDEEKKAGRHVVSWTER
jgi:hypothetical protein